MSSRQILMVVARSAVRMRCHSTSFRATPSLSTSRFAFSGWSNTIYTRTLLQKGASSSRVFPVSRTRIFGQSSLRGTLRRLECPRHGNSGARSKHWADRQRTLQAIRPALVGNPHHKGVSLCLEIRVASPCLWGLMLVFVRTPALKSMPTEGGAASDERAASTTGAL